VADDDLLRAAIDKLPSGIRIAIDEAGAATHTNGRLAA
jgi:hypothetical protein